MGRCFNLYVCVFVFVCVCLYVCVFVCVLLHVHICWGERVCLQKWPWMESKLSRCIYCVCVCVCVCVCIPVFVCGSEGLFCWFLTSPFCLPQSTHTHTHTLKHTHSRYTTVSFFPFKVILVVQPRTTSKPLRPWSIHHPHTHALSKASTITHLLTFSD